MHLRDEAPGQGRRHPSVVVVVAVAVVLTVAGCASSTKSSDSGRAAGTRVTGAAAPRVGPGPADGGWDCGSACDWGAAAGNGAPVVAELDPVAVDELARRAVDHEHNATTATSSTTRVSSTPETAAPAGGTPANPAATTKPAAAIALPSSTGSIDDNADLAAYLTYQRAFASTGLAFEPLSVEGRRVITVLDRTGEPVPGAEITIQTPSGALVTSLVTRTDGRALFHPAEQDRSSDFVAAVSYQGWMASAPLVAAEPSVSISIQGPVLGPDVPSVDVFFLIDATWSMRDEVARLQQNFRALAQKIESLPRHPEVHFGMTVYRDRGDAFATRTFDFTSDVDQFASALDEIVASGGGDTPESLAAGLRDAVAKPAWRGPGTTQLLFVITDAPPHLEDLAARQVGPSVTTANQRGITILPIASTGIDATGEYALRQLAQQTAGRFVFATNGADGAGPLVATPHVVTPDAYSSLAIDEVIAQLVADGL